MPFFRLTATEDVLLKSLKFQFRQNTQVTALYVLFIIIEIRLKGMLSSGILNIIICILINDLLKTITHIFQFVRNSSTYCP